MSCCCGSGKAAGRSDTAASEGLVVHVPDMSCGGCAEAIKSALRDLAPDAQVSVDVSSRTIRVFGTSDIVVISDAVRRAGFTPSAAPRS